MELLFPIWSKNTHNFTCCCVIISNFCVLYLYAQLEFAPPKTTPFPSRKIHIKLKIFVNSAHLTSISEKLHSVHARTIQPRGEYLGGASDDTESTCGADCQQIRQIFQLTKFDYMNCFLAVQTKPFVFRICDVWHRKWYKTTKISRHLCKQPRIFNSFE